MTGNYLFLHPSYIEVFQNLVQLSMYMEDSQSEISIKYHCKIYMSLLSDSNRTAVQTMEINSETGSHLTVRRNLLQTTNK